MVAMQSLASVMHTCSAKMVPPTKPFALMDCCSTMKPLPSNFHANIQSRLSAKHAEHCNRHSQPNNVHINLDTFDWAIQPIAVHTWIVPMALQQLWSVRSAWHSTKHHIYAIGQTMFWIVMPRLIWAFGALRGQTSSFTRLITASITFLVRTVNHVWMRVPVDLHSVRNWHNAQRSKMWLDATMRWRMKMRTSPNSELTFVEIEDNLQMHFIIQTTLATTCKWNNKWNSEKRRKRKEQIYWFFFRRISWRHFIYLPCPTWKVISATRNYSTGNGCRQAVIDIQSNDWELSAIEYEKKTITESISNFIWPEHALGYEIVIYLPAISLFPFCVWYDQLQHIDIRWHHIVWLVLICTYSQRIRTER